MIDKLVLAIIVGTIVGFTAGYIFERRSCTADIAVMRAEIAAREIAAAEEANRRIEVASMAMDAALKEKENRMMRLEETNRRLRGDFKATTAGQSCLSASTRSVLQQSPAFGATLSSATGSTVTANATATADSRYSTDTDIAEWVIDTATLYEQCRSRIDALRAWDSGVYGK